MGLIRSLALIRSLLASAEGVDFELREPEERPELVRLIRTDREARELARALVMRTATGVARPGSEPQWIHRLSNEELLHWLDKRLAKLLPLEPPHREVKA